MTMTPATPQSQPTSPVSSAVDTLQPLRRALLDLHQALLDGERAAVERERGERLAPGELLHALLHDARWAWLRPLGALVAGIDEAVFLAGKGEITLGEPELRAFAAETRRLMAGAAPLLGERYLQLVQESPDVAVTVGAVRRGLDRLDERSLVA
jgi:hypothetical protein